jgi:hypothetical protein
VVSQRVSGRRHHPTPRHQSPFFAVIVWFSFIGSYMGRMPRRPIEPGSPGWKDPRLNLSRAEFRPYATALGQIALAWNGLLERLAFLFCMVMGGGQVNHFFATWYAIKNDRAQRDMLLAATKVDIANLSLYCPKLKEDITWLLKRCDEIEEARNDALHSPFVLMHSGVQPGYHMT